jgi:hypothetical protein
LHVSSDFSFYNSADAKFMMGTLGQQHWDGVLWPGKLASGAGYQLQAHEEDDISFTNQQRCNESALGLESELSPFEQQQQQGHEVTSQPVEADGSSVELEHINVNAGTDDTSRQLATLPR